MRRMVVLVAICTILFSFSNAYVDLDKSHLDYYDMKKLVQQDAISGYPDNTFRPDSYMTEMELITVLLRCANLEVCKSFKKWPEDYLNMAIESGIVSDESLVTVNEIDAFMKKISIIPRIKYNGKTYDNKLYDKYNLLGNLDKSEEYVTRAEACRYINGMFKEGVEMKTIFPCELENYYSNMDALDITTIINSIEVFEYDSYNGKYADIINSIKNGEHRYLQKRDELAQGKYVVAIEFDTVNNSQYGTWTSYNSLILEDVEVVDSFDLDEIDSQILNLPYTATLINSNSNHVVTAFYVVNNMPSKMTINCDINTLYDLHTHKYVDVNFFNKININL